LRRRIESRLGAGQPLAPSLRRQLEDGLGYDLSSVTVHVDAKADDLARSLGADAFTCGNDIFFRGGAFQPDTLPGRFLIDHEAVHVIQQAHGEAWGSLRMADLALSAPNDPLEQVANETAARLIAGSTCPPLIFHYCGTEEQRKISPSAPLLIQRHGSFEHRLLGDGPTNDLVSISTNGADRSTILQRQ